MSLKTLSRKGTDDFPLPPEGLCTIQKAQVSMRTKASEHLGLRESRWRESQDSATAGLARAEVCEDRPTELENNYTETGLSSTYQLRCRSANSSLCATELTDTKTQAEGVWSSPDSEERMEAVHRKEEKRTVKGGDEQVAGSRCPSLSLPRLSGSTWL